MGKTVRLRVCGPTPIHGREPGEEFEIETDNDGEPIDILWRKRLRDEALFRVGAVEISTNVPASTTTEN